MSALALDRDTVGCRLTAEVVRQDTLEDSASPNWLCVSGEDMPSLIKALGNLLPDELYLSHAQVLLISEDVASDTILPLADYLCENPDVRLSLRVAVVRDGTAEDLLRTDEEVFALSEMLDHAADKGVLPDMPLYRAVNALHADGTAILPALRIDEFGQASPAGTAVFARERLTCFLDGNETSPVENNSGTGNGDTKNKRKSSSKVDSDKDNNDKDDSEQEGRSR